MNPQIPVCAFVGRSNSGKTSLLERLIPELGRRGYRLAVLKHFHQRGVTFDKPGKDSWRLAQAGADQVVLAAPDKTITIQHHKEEPPLEQVLVQIRGVDLVLVEGHKDAPVPKIEVNRRARSTDLACADDAHLVAVVSDQTFDLDLPQFDLDNVQAIADFLEERLLRSR